MDSGAASSPRHGVPQVRRDRRSRQVAAGRGNTRSWRLAKTRDNVRTMLRRLATICLLLGLSFRVGCERSAEQPQGGTCQSITWGGFNGTPECAGIAASVIQAQHRTCLQDSDCALLAANACSAHAVNAQALPAYSNHPPPCNHPLAGMCIPVPWRAVCQQGCCSPSSAPPPPTF